MDVSDTTAKPKDFLIPQDWAHYTPEEHETWNILYNRLKDFLPGRACQEYIDCLDSLPIGKGIPDFRDLNAVIKPKTGWEVVAVPGLIPDKAFFEMLANRKFPAGNFIRKREQLDYIEEPDVFHDVFGHVPLLTHPVFADYMEKYGRAGEKAMAHKTVNRLSRLYWFTVEFGLINTPEGMRIYGAGIVSSPSETHFSLNDPSPNRLEFDLKRVMRTQYRYDDFQETYFVINSFQELFDATIPVDFAPIYEEIKTQPEYGLFDIAPTDKVLHRGTGDYARNSTREKKAKVK
jgi:phenylalanine-4-hydroxylase